MAHGIFLGGQAILPLQIQDASGRWHEYEFVLDTGFTEFLVLPPTIVSAHELGWQNRTLVRLAGGVSIEADVYEVVVLWNGEPRTVPVYALEGEPLIGMLFLQGNEVRIQVDDGGLVAVEPI